MVMIPRPQVGGIMSGPATTVASATPLKFLLEYVEFSKKKYTPWTLWMPFLPGRIYGTRPILDIHSRQSDRVARVDIEMDSSAVVP